MFLFLWTCAFALCKFALFVHIPLLCHLFISGSQRKRFLIARARSFTHLHAEKVALWNSGASLGLFSGRWTWACKLHHIFPVGFCLWQYFIEGSLLCRLQPKTLCYVVSVLIRFFFFESSRLYFLYVLCSLRFQCQSTFWARFMFHTLGADVFAYSCVLSTTSRHMSAWRVTSAYHRPAFVRLISIFWLHFVLPFFYTGSASGTDSDSWFRPACIIGFLFLIFISLFILPATGLFSHFRI